jgi:purine-cytosine permease-like protein
VLVGGVVMGATAYYGYRGMEILSVVSVPLLLILAGWVTWRSFAEIGANGGFDALGVTGETSIAVAVTAIVGTWTTNDNTAYNFGVAGAELFNANTKKPFVIGGVIIGTLLAMPIYDNLIGYLSWLGILIPPVGGVIIGDWLVHWRKGMPEPLAYRFPAVRWENLAVYTVATFLAWLSSNNGWFIPPVNGVVLAIAGVALMSRLTSPTSARSAPPPDPLRPRARR